MLSFLDWSKETISFSREDHLNHISNPGHYSLVVDHIIGNSRFSKMLMDSGCSHNILYSPALELMGIGLDKLRPSKSPFHGVAPGKRVQPPRQIDLHVYSACWTTSARRYSPSRWWVPGSVPHHPWTSVLHQIHAVPNYTHLKMKMSGPNDIITVGLSIKHDYECDVECVERAEALALDEALLQDLEKMANEGLYSTSKHAGSFVAAGHIKPPTTSTTGVN
jgi:hypothetical protein